MPPSAPPTLEPASGPVSRPDRASRPGAAGRPVPGSPAALDLLALARHGLVEAGLLTAPAERYATAHLAALRAAAAVLAARTGPAAAPRARRPSSAWTLLAQVAPELGEWSAFFAAGAGKRAAAEAGISRAATGREADDLLRDVERFLALVETTLGLPHQPVLAAAAG